MGKTVNFQNKAILKSFKKFQKKYKNPLSTRSLRRGNATSTKIILQ
jgi:hypothetical protein